MLDDKRALQRRKELGLSEKFQVIRRPPFRFFTDVDLRGARSVLEQMMASIQSHYQKYLEIMEPFGLRWPEEGLDVILFNDPEDYFRVTGAPRGSAGVYIFDRKAGHFFRWYGSYNFSTMLHEMTHQLNDKVLEAIGLSGWFEEGMAEYFGAGHLTQGGRRIELGRVDPDRLSAFNAAVRRIGGRQAIPLDEFLGMPHARLTGEYYSQAWALVHYLMQGPFPGRAILFDYATAGKAARHGRGEARSFEEILKDYGVTLADFEKAFLRHYREGKG